MGLAIIHSISEITCTIMDTLLYSKVCFSDPQNALPYAVEGMQRLRYAFRTPPKLL